MSSTSTGCSVPYKRSTRHDSTVLDLASSSVSSWLSSKTAMNYFMPAHRFWFMFGAISATISLPIYLCLSGALIEGAASRLNCFNTQIMILFFLVLDYDCRRGSCPLLNILLYALCSKTVGACHVINSQSANLEVEDCVKKTDSASGAFCRLGAARRRVHMHAKWMNATFTGKASMDALQNMHIFERRLKQFWISHKKCGAVQVQNCKPPFQFSSNWHMWPNVDKVRFSIGNLAFWT